MLAVGEVVWVPTEEAIDVVTALSGSGPAYFFLLAELMAEAASDWGSSHRPRVGSRSPPSTARV
jgi:pyrroline-5-carboxylate reductase